ncbi:MAG: homogentisate 1,2-dioxygenase [Candidatus Eisenbacteria bacterium]|uniref:Homogentisate 1,2-dioxygenase n=1 Tax=Eiseniibacteriota bacterium TaxID=2212470 RepID=A0A7Y2EAT8_UNCEI|nr:homogentisate 1,2-dioxygenase [Candidatus Eisenbacteria bacterium]
MPFYQTRGEIPAKRHIAFKNPKGGIFFEELVGNEGFTGASSLLYHLQRPTRVTAIEHHKDLPWKAVSSTDLRPHHFRLGNLPPGGDAALDRTPFLYNHEVALSVVHPTKTTATFYRNSQADEIVYVAKGKGTLRSPYGKLAFSSGYYLVIPRGVIHSYEFASSDTFLFVVESTGVVRIPKRYRNSNGQLLEGAPYSERDIHTPVACDPVEEMGAFPVHTKMRNAITVHTLEAHPYDVVGWDGSYYPWAFDIRDFEPIVGRIHQPPPVHQTFAGDGFVVCSFVPRLYDFHPEAIPAPYHHTNAQSEELLFYASDEFMSRKGIEFGSATYHPDGMAHGPHPGKAEESIGKKSTDELAVMVDTFRPLKVCEAAMGVDDPAYPQSWLE